MCIDLPLHQPCFESTAVINEISFKIYVYAVKFLIKKRQDVKIKEFNLKNLYQLNIRKWTVCIPSLEIWNHFWPCNFIVTYRCFDTMLQGKKTVTFRLIVIYLKYEIYDLKHLIKPVLAFGPSCAYQKTPRVTWVEDI